MSVAVIKYNAGNTRSVVNALDRLGVSALVTNDPETIRASDKVIFPGVGHASAAMQSLRESGLNRLIPTLSQPVLGICLGMQLMCAYSEEGDTTAMGIFPNKVRLFQGDLKVPHMGWNTTSANSGSLFETLPTASRTVPILLSSQGSSTPSRRVLTASMSACEATGVPS